MRRSWPPAPACPPETILPFLSQGRVVGVYDPEGRLDWEGALPAGLILYPSTGIRPTTRPLADHYYCLLCTGDREHQPSLAGRARQLARRSRGVAVVADRVGVLLRTAHQLLVAGGGQRVAEPGLTMGLSLADPALVSASAVLVLRTPTPEQALRLLGPWYRGVERDGTVIRVPLAGSSAEEVLQRLSSQRVPVSESRVWFPHLQARSE